MKSSIEIKKIAENVINIEYRSIQNLIKSINDDFVQAVKLISDKIMKSHNITQLIVLENGSYKGIIHLHDIIKEGIVQ